MIEEYRPIPDHEFYPYPFTEEERKRNYNRHYEMLMWRMNHEYKRMKPKIDKQNKREPKRFPGQLPTLINPIRSGDGRICRSQPNNEKKMQKVNNRRLRHQKLKFKYESNSDMV